MKRSSSLPMYKNNLNNSNNKLPKITNNPWITNSSSNSDIKYMNGGKYLPEKYMIMKKDKLNAIENNYYDMRFLLNNKINRLEKNQRKFNEILKYSLAQNRLQNDINNFNYDKHLQNYYERDNYEKQYLIDLINQMPLMIEKKINRIFLDEYESSRNQKQFIENLKERMIDELKNQRRYDYYKYKQQLNELMKLKENEEHEKLQLLNEIQNQKLKYEIKAMKYQNQLYHYNNPYGGYPIYPIILPKKTQPKSITSSIDEFMKVLLFKEMIGSYQKYNDYQNYMNEILPDLYGLGKSYDTSFREFIKYKKRNKTNWSKSYNSENGYYNQNYWGNERNMNISNNVPFINSGITYSKVNDKNKNNKKRFITSHNSEINNDDQKEKKKDKKRTEKSESQKSKTQSKTESKTASKKSKTNTESSGGSEKSNEDNSDKESKSESNNDNKDKTEEKKEETKDEEKKEETQNEEKKEETKDGDKEDETQSDDDDSEDSNKEEENKQEGQ